MNPVADIGVTGLGVMGRNLSLNLERNGFTAACYDRSIDRMEAFLAEEGTDKRLIGCRNLSEMIGVLKRPRKLLCLIPAGRAIDDWIAEVSPLLDVGDVLIDGGNSHFRDTARRVEAAEAAGLLYVGAGISGGKAGALHGPSIMPGGSKAAWPILRPIFQAICAVADDGTPCCDWIGAGGAGHFVKMVHNGIEYADMQLIAEIYQTMRDGLGLSSEEMAEVFSRWNEGPLGSYLIEITAHILAYRDRNGELVLEHIRDTASEKGTGRWMIEAGLEAGVPVSATAEAVFARWLSAQKRERATAARILAGPRQKPDLDGAPSVEALEEALYAARIVSHGQGFRLLQVAADRERWGCDLGSIARIWRKGCIIRSALMNRMAEALAADPDPARLLVGPMFREALATAQNGWRNTVAFAVRAGIPMPTIGTALAYYDGMRTDTLPTNLIQAQRDCFGAHGYERRDGPPDHMFHIDWMETDLP